MPLPRTGQSAGAPSARESARDLPGIGEVIIKTHIMSSPRCSRSGKLEFVLHTWGKNSQRKVLKWHTHTQPSVSKSSPSNFVFNFAFLLFPLSLVILPPALVWSHTIQ